MGGGEHEHTGWFFFSHSFIKGGGLFMKKRYRSLVLLLAGALLAGLSVGPCLATDTGAAALSTDGTLKTESKAQMRTTQAQRNAAAKRSAAGGLVVPKVGVATSPSPAPQTEGGPTK